MLDITLRKFKLKKMGLDLFNFNLQYLLHLYPLNIFISGNPGKTGSGTHFFLLSVPCAVKSLSASQLQHNAIMTAKTPPETPSEQRNDGMTITVIISAQMQI